MNEATSIVTVIGALSLGVLSLCIWLVKYVATTLADKIKDNTAATKEVGDKLHKASEFQRREHEHQIEMLSKVLLQTPK